MNKPQHLKYIYKLKQYGVWYPVFERFIISFYWYQRKSVSWINCPKLKQLELWIYYDEEQLELEKQYYDNKYKEVSVLLERFWENVKDIKKLDIWFDNDDDDDDDDDLEELE